MANKQPYTYRILSRCNGAPVTKGESILCDTDLRILYGWPGFPDYFGEVVEKELNGEIAKKDQVRVIIDHMLPSRDQAQCDYLDLVRQTCEKLGLECWDTKGIGHHLAIEQGWAKPGMFITHFDTHVASVGAIGALGLGSAIEMLVPFATGKCWLDVPPVYRVDLSGKLTPGVMGRDLLHYMVDRLGTESYGGAVLEFFCAEDCGLTLDDKMTICNLINYLGAMSATFVPSGEEKGEDGCYEEIIQINLSALEPYLGCPPATNNPAPLSEHAGKEINMAVVGTCSGGGLNDIATAAKILRGKTIAKGMKLFVCPATNKIFQDAIDKGYIKDLVSAGAFISSPTCDFCYGRAVYLQKGHRAISTSPLNVPGRFGSQEAEIFLASSAVTAYSALKGEIADPRPAYKEGGLN